MAGTSQTEDVDLLFEALERFDHAAVDQILSDNPEIVNARKSTVEKDVSPLLLACSSGASNVIEVLLNHGADVNCKGHRASYHSERPLGHYVLEPPPRSEGGYGAFDNVFPIYLAAMTVSIPVVQALISKGADLKQVTATGQTVLHVACRNRDGSHLARFAGLGYKPKRKADAVDLVHLLMNNGVELNTRDCLGRTPLYYACIAGNRYIVKALLAKGADPMLRDGYGLSVLEVAAYNNYNVMEDLQELEVWSNQEKVEAYEICALSASQDRGSSMLKSMSKATYLRIELNCPKTVMEPLYRYASVKEWETLGEVERMKDNLQEIKEQCLLCRERIFDGRYLDIDQAEIAEVIMGVHDKAQRNALLRHYLDIFRRNDDHLYFVSIFVRQGRLLKIMAGVANVDILTTETIEDIFHLALESAVQMRSTLEKETRRGAIRELLNELEQALLTAGAFILLLLRRPKQPEGDRKEYEIAKSLLQKLLETFPHISVPQISYFNPLLNLMLNKKYSSFVSATYPILPDVDMVKLFVECGVNINATDSAGNTGLHIAIVPFPIRPMLSGAGSELRPNPYSRTEEIARLFLNEGAYVHARNKAKQTVVDIIGNPDNKNFFDQLPNLPKMLEEYQGLPTLKRLTAEYLSDSHIPITNQLPDALKEFVNLH